MAEGHIRFPNQKSSPPASSSLLPSVNSTGAGQPVRPSLKHPWMSEGQIRQDHHAGLQSAPPARLFQELFCTGQTSGTLAPLASALVTSAQLQSDVVRRGYLGKQERSHRRYFVLRAGSHTGPSRLEWYKSQETFTAAEESAGKTTLFSSSKQGVVYLRCCLGVSRISSSRKGHMVAVYAKDQTVVLVMEDQQVQEEWCLAIKRLMEEERRDEEHGEGLDEEDDGYCTLPPAGFFKEVWPVTVKPRGLACSKSLAGESRLCLTATSLILVRVGSCSDLPSVTIPLLSVRRFGHLDGSFFLELGRSAPNGPGELWMEARDQGNTAVAQQIHEVVRETVRALRALPDFSRSPVSKHIQLQNHLVLKRCRPKYREKAVNVKPLGSPLTHPKIHQGPPRPDPASSPLSPVGFHQGSAAVAGSYMEMKMDLHHPGNRWRDWEAGEEEEEEEENEGREYMTMSPQVKQSSSVLAQEDYMTMASPRKHNWSSCSSLQTSFNSSTSDSPSHLQTCEYSRPCWPVKPVLQSETEASQTRTSPSTEQEPNTAEQSRLPVPAHARPALHPFTILNMSNTMATPDPRGPVYTKPVQASPSSSQLQAEHSVRRCRLSFCLPSCLQAEDRS